MCQSMSDKKLRLNSHHFELTCGCHDQFGLNDMLSQDGMRKGIQPHVGIVEGPVAMLPLLSDSEGIFRVV